MSRKYLQINQVDLDTDGWTVIIQVVEKGHVQFGRTGKKVPYRRYVFTDSQGTIVGATAYGSQVEFWEDRIIQYKRYYVSGARVQPANPQFQISEYAFTWSLQKGTLVEPFPEKLPPQLPCKIQLQEYAKLRAFAETDHLQNVIGVVVHALPPKNLSAKSTTKELIIVNAENKPMILTLWNEFAKEEGAQLASTLPTGNIIVAMRVRVTTFNLLSVTTTYQSNIMINPPMAEAATLKQWYLKHKDEVSHLLELKVYKDPEFLLPPPNESEIISVQTALKNLHILKTAWIRGTAVLTHGQTSYWTTVCQTCKKALRAQVGWIITCTKCNTEGPVEPWCRFTLGIEDNSGLIQAVISGPEAEQLLPMTAAQMSLNKNHLQTAMEVEANFEKKHITCFIRHYIPDYQDGDESGYAVVVVYINEENIEPEIPVDETATLVHQQALGKQVLVEEQLTPTAHKLLASMLDTPSPAAPEKGKRTATVAVVQCHLWRAFAHQTRQNVVGDITSFVERVAWLRRVRRPLQTGTVAKLSAPENSPPPPTEKVVASFAAVSPLSGPAKRNIMDWQWTLDFGLDIGTLN
ncbi:Unknown protein [Striga hermonthica]|uniref:Uncharacterized protein n=1 Tax=Striga hermonthica TaxID=68872 RepID=A0A9N7P254_STRHE|nr:Unknown protein [Striga hermonthica]